MLEMLVCWVRIAKGFLVDSVGFLADSWGIPNGFLRDSSLTHEGFSRGF